MREFADYSCTRIDSPAVMCCKKKEKKKEIYIEIKKKKKKRTEKSKNYLVIRTCARVNREKYRISKHAACVPLESAVLRP